MEVKISDNFYYFSCPHCNDDIVVNIKELNCRIFRHAIYKHNYEQVNPHLSKKDCDSLVENNKVYGCCKPFEIISRDNKLFVTVCDYK